MENPYTIPIMNVRALLIALEQAQAGVGRDTAVADAFAQVIDTDLLKELL